MALLRRSGFGPAHRGPARPSNILFSCLTALFVLGGWILPARAEIIERVVAVVGNDIVLLSEVNARLRPYLKRVLSIKDPAARQQALERLQRREVRRLVDEKLILQEAIRRKIEVTEGEVNRAIQSVLRQNKITYKELEEALRSQGQSMEEYRTILRKQILRLKVINFAVRSRIAVSEDEARAFYESQKRRLGVQKKVRVRVIRLAVGSHNRAAVLERATKLAARLRTHPEEFEAKAKALSNHPSASKGGLLGFIDRGALPPVVERKVVSAQGKPPVLVGPVGSDEGIYLVQILGRKESEALPFSQVKDKVRQQVLMQRMQVRTAKWLEQLRKKTYIDIRL